MQKIKSSLALGLIRLIGYLSLSQGRKLGRNLGWCAYKLNTRMARTTYINLKLCQPQFSEQARAQLTQTSLQATGMLAAEVCHVFTQPDQVMPSIVGVTGAEIAKAHLAEGKGLLVLAPHLGNWEVLGWYLPTLAPLTNMYLPPKLKGLDQLIRTCRTRAGSSLVPTNAKGVAAILKALRNGEICGILPDQNPAEESGGEFAPFFGHPAFTMKLVYKLLQKTGAKAVFAYAKRVETGFEVVIRDAPAELYSDDLSTSLTALNQGIEALALETPAQYQWEYKRFRIRPQGTPTIYH